MMQSRIARTLVAAFAILLTASCGKDATDPDGSGGTNEPRVVLTPERVVLVHGQNFQFEAVAIGYSNPGIRWSVDEGVRNGAVSSEGLYTSPGNLPDGSVVRVRATAEADPSASDVGFVTLWTATNLLIISPTTVEVGAGESAHFSVELREQGPTSAVWRIEEGPGYGFIGIDGTYVAPNPLPPVASAHVVAAWIYNGAATARAEVVFRRN